MGEVGAFLRIERVNNPERDPRERKEDFREFVETLPVPQLQEQGARCMECGVPFCHNGCPLGNLIPDWNDLVYRDRWRDAIDQLHATNNFPEFTGKLCPAPCEAACVLEIREGDAVSIKQIEVSIINRAWDEGWVVPRPPAFETGRTVAVIGAGPSGLAAAQQLRRAGHTVTVYERDEAPGGLLRFGVPDAKLEKWIIDRRLKLLEQEGIIFECGVDAGRDISVEELRHRHDALVIAIGSRMPRGLDVPGSELQGVHPAMDYLYQRNRWVAREQGRSTVEPALGTEISAKGKRVVVVGGGDTGMDCVSNALREGAEDVQMLDVYPELPPSGRLAGTPWPLPPKRTLTTYALEEGGERRWASQVTEVVGRDGRVAGVRARKVEGTSSRDLKAVPGSEFEQETDLVLVAIGFTHPEHEGLVESLGVDLDSRGNVRAPVYGTFLEGVFACGDARIGQSLVVTAIAEGRRCARIVDRHLGGTGIALPVRAEEMFVYEDDDPGSLRHQAETAGNVTVGDAFWAGPRDPA